MCIRDSWQALAQWIHEVTGNREVLDPMFDGPSSSRLPHRELLDVFIGDFTAKLTVSEVYHEGQRRRIAFTPCNTPARIARDEHLAARRFFEEVETSSGRRIRMPGPASRADGGAWTSRRRAPLLGEHDAELVAGSTAPHAGSASRSRHAALEGSRVVEFGAGMAGPWIGRFMACLLYTSPSPRDRTRSRMPSSA